MAGAEPSNGRSGGRMAMTISSYSVTELWQRLPLHLVKDIFSYFSFHDFCNLHRYSTKKKVDNYPLSCQTFSVSPVWKSMLSNLAVFNRGILFVHDCDLEYLYTIKEFLSLLKRGTVKHLVFRGATFRGAAGYVTHFHDQVIQYCCDIDANGKSAVATLTVCNVKWSLEEWLSAMGLSVEPYWPKGLFSLTNIARIVFVKCTFEVSVAHFWSFNIEHPVKTLYRDSKVELQRQYERRWRATDSC